MKLSKAFRLGAEIIDQPGKWGKGAYYGAGGKCCMIGAMCFLAKSEPRQTRINDGGFILFGWEIAEFNDAPDTTQADAVLGSLVVAEYLRGLGK